MKKNSIVTFTLLFSIIFTAMANEEPKYQITKQQESFELRIYEPKIIAQALVSGSLDDASSAGFRIIADYIFGNNLSTSNTSEKISMTAPVIIEPQSEKINMTAPVSIKQGDGQWAVSFVMPSEYTLATLPKPVNPAVKIIEIPSKQYAVIRFSGLAGEKKVAEKTTELLDWLKQFSVVPIGTPELARYNPPWTLPFLRRNEVLIEY